MLVPTLLTLAYILVGVLIVLVLERKGEYFDGKDCLITTSMWPAMLFVYLVDILSELNRKS